LKIILIRALFVVGFFTSYAALQATDCEPSVLSESSESLEVNARLYDSPLARLYKVRTLLENHTCWNIAYEALRDLQKNYKGNFSSSQKKKLNKIIKQVKWYGPRVSLGNSLRKVRYLVRPFIETQYILNELLMEFRPIVNLSNDSEILFVEDLIKTFLFPGFEEDIEIIYPPRSAYSFDIYSLDNQNLNNTKRGYKEDLEDSNTSSSSYTGKSSQRDDYRISPVALKNGYHEVLNKGDISSSLLDSLFGISMDEISPVVEDLIEKHEKIRKYRLKQRFLPQSLLLSAIVEPGLAALDPQIQDFLKEVKIKIKVAEVDLEKDELNETLSYLKELNYIITSADAKSLESKINFQQFLTLEDSSKPFQSELLLESIDGGKRNALYFVSFIGGSSLDRLRVFQFISMMLKTSPDVLKFKKALSQSKHALVFSKALISDLSRFLLTVSKNNVLTGKIVSAVTNMGSKLEFMKSMSKTAELLKNAGGQGSLLGKISSNKFVTKTKEFSKSGKLLQTLVAITVAAEFSVGVIEYISTNDYEKKHDIYTETGARMVSSLSYLLPFGIGILAGSVDFLNFVGVSPVNSVDAVNGIVWGAKEVALMLHGTSHDKMVMDDIEISNGLPMDIKYFDSKLKHIRKDKESSSIHPMLISNYMSEYAYRNLVVLYLAHQNFGSKINNYFGNRIFTLHKSFLETQKKYKYVLENEFVK